MRLAKQSLLVRKLDSTSLSRSKKKKKKKKKIGQGLHYAFGLATDADIFAEDEKVKKLEMRVNEELNSLQASMVENLNEMSRLTKEAGRMWEDLDERMKEEKIIEEWDALFGSITFLLDMATELKFKKNLLANNMVPSRYGDDERYKKDQRIWRVKLHGPVLRDRN